MGGEIVYNMFFRAKQASGREGRIAIWSFFLCIGKGGEFFLLLMKVMMRSLCDIILGRGRLGGDGMERHIAGGDTRSS